MAKKHLMKPSLKTVVAILVSSIVKTDDVTSGRRDVNLHGRLHTFVYLHNLLQLPKRVFQLQGY